MPLTQRERFLSTMGLAARAGRLQFGADAVCEALRAGKAELVVEADGNSPNTHKRLTDKCAYYRVKLISAGVDSGSFGASLGRRGALAAAAVCDPSLAKAVLNAAVKAEEEINGTETEKTQH